MVHKKASPAKGTTTKRLHGRPKETNTSVLLTQNPEKRIYEMISEIGEQLNGEEELRIMRMLTKEAERTTTYRVRYAQYCFEIAFTTKGYTFWPVDGYPGIGAKAMLDMLNQIQVNKRIKKFKDGKRKYTRRTK